MRPKKWTDTGTWLETTVPGIHRGAEHDLPLRLCHHLCMLQREGLVFAALVSFFKIQGRRA